MEPSYGSVRANSLHGPSDCGSLHFCGLAVEKQPLAKSAEKDGQPHRLVSSLARGGVLLLWVVI